MHSRQWILLSALLAGCGGSVDLEPSTEDAGADSAAGPTLGAACSPVDDPQVAPAHSRLAQQSREANVALATAACSTGFPGSNTRRSSRTAFGRHNRC